MRTILAGVLGIVLFLNVCLTGVWAEEMGSGELVGGSGSTYVEGSVSLGEATATGGIVQADANPISSWATVDSQTQNSTWTSSIEAAMRLQSQSNATMMSFESQNPKLVSEYLLNDNADDTSGNMLNGVSQNVTYHNSAIWNWKKSAQFQSNGYVDTLTTAMNFGRGDAFSISGWFQTSNAGGSNIIVSNEYDYPYTGYVFYLIPDGGLVFDFLNHYANSRYKLETVTNGYSDGNWHHFTLAYNWAGASAWNFTSYVDGSPVGLSESMNTIGQNDWVSNHSMYIGARPYEPAQHFEGRLQNIRFFNYARSQADVASEYISSNAIFAKYPLNGNADDTSWNNRNGTATNVTWTNGNNPSAKLNGTDASLRFGDTIQNGGPGWFSAWIRLDAQSPSGEYYMVNDWSSNKGIVGIIGYDYNWGNSRIKFMRAKSGVSTDTSVFPINMDSSKFYHLVWVYDGTNVYGYVNGIKSAITPSSGIGWQVSNGFHVGEYNENILRSPITVNRLEGGRYVPADIEINSIYNSELNGIPRDWLKAEYFLNGNSDDTSGNWYNGTGSEITYGQDWAESTNPNANSRILSSGNLGINWSNVTLSWWIKLKWNHYPTGNDHPMAFGEFSGSPNWILNGIWFSMDNSQVIFSRLKTQVGWIDAPYSISPRIWEWHHYAYTYDGDSIRGYVDGALVTTLATSGSWVPENRNVWAFLFGSDYNWSTSNQASVGLKNVRIYNRALSTSEIQSLYHENSTVSNPNTAAPVLLMTCPPISICAYSHSIWTNTNNPTAANSPNAQIESSNSTTISNVGDPITLSTGESTYENTFLRTTSTQLPYEFKLTNRTRVTYDGPVGLGWDHNHNIFLREDQDGSVRLYDGKLGIHGFPYDSASNTYGKNASLGATLTKDANNFYHVRFSTGMKYDFGANLRIEHQIDRYGNHLDYAYDGERLTTVTDGLNRAVTYAYLENGRLDTVTDSSNRVVKLQYYTMSDSLGGENDLKSVTISSGTPVQSKTVSYTYSQVAGNETLSHNLKTLVDAKGQTYVNNTFDTDDRVTDQVFGNGTLHYAYEMDAGNTYIAKTTVTNRLGTVTDYQYDQNGNILSTTIHGTTPADNIVNSFVYDATGRLTRETKPLGNGITYEYDAIGNVTKKREKADMSVADDDSQDLVTTSVYGGDFNQLLERTTPGGTRSVLTYDALGNMIKTEVQNVHLDDSETTHTLFMQYEYDAQGRVTKTTDPEGNITAIVYGASGFATSITKGLRATETVGIYDETNASTTSYTYDGNGNPLTTTDGEGKVSTFTYDAFDRLVTSLSPAGIAKTYLYDPNNLLMRTETALNATTKRTEVKAYDMLDQVINSMVMGAPTEWAFNMTSYNGNQNVTATTDAMGLRTTYAYDVLEHVREKRVIVDPTHPEKDLVTTYAYDKNGNLIQTTDPTGAVTHFAYDAFGRLTSSTDAANTTAHIAYDRDGRPTETSTTIPGVGEGAEPVILSHKTIAYNEIGKVLSESILGTGESATSLVTKYSYDQNGNVLVKTNPMGKSVTSTYDSLGRLKKVRDVLGNETRFAYDRRGLLTIRKTVGSDGKEVATAYGYDDDGRKIRETDANGNFVTYAYDKLNRITQKTDEAGHVTDYAYDIFDNLLSQTSHLSPTETVTLRYEYDKRNQLTKLTDASGNVTRYEYDALGRKSKEIQADGTFATFAYDGTKLASTTDANGTVVTNSYDALGRLTGRSIATGSGVLGTTSETYSYDALGRMAGASSSQSGSAYELGFAYNAFGNLVSETQNGKAVNYAYDKNGNRRSITTDGFGETGTGVAAYVANYAYDELDRLAGVTYNGGNVANYAYTGVILNGISFGNGTDTSYAYDALNRLSEIGYGTTGIPTRNFAYSADGNITSDGSKDYAYDPIGRVTDIASHTGSTLSTESRGFGYDAMGNRTAVENRLDAGTETYDRNELNQYTSVTGSGTTSYSYDANGNVVDNGEFHFAYDYRNRVVEVRKSGDGSLVAAYSYDALGRRTKKAVGSTITDYLYAGSDAIAERNTSGGVALSTFRVYGDGTDDLLAYETEESSLTGSEAEEYSFCLARVVPYAADFAKYGHASVVERCDALHSSSLVTTRKTYFLHRDQLGSTVALTDGSGSVVQRYAYDAFGKAYVGVGAVLTGSGSGATVSAQWVPVAEFAGSLHGNDRLYTGREYDRETGLYSYRARTYDADTGRFLQRDPVGVVDQVNLYTYVSNSPMRYVDPTGMTAETKEIIMVWKAKRENEFQSTVEYYRNLALKAWVKESNIVVLENIYSVQNMNRALKVYGTNIRNITYISHAWQHKFGTWKQVITEDDLYEIDSINHNSCLATTLTLVSCNSWGWNAPIAQKLSNELGVNVIAPNNYILPTNPPLENSWTWEKFVGYAVYWAMRLSHEKWEPTLLGWIGSWNTFKPSYYNY